MILAAIKSVLKGLTIYPVIPFWTISGIPPKQVPTTGFLQAIASKLTVGKGSK